MKPILNLLFAALMSAGIAASAQTLVIKPGGVVTICEGDTVTFTATSGFVRYVWSTGEFTQSIKAWRSGRYYVVALDRSSKAHADSVDLKVVSAARPNIVIKPSNRTICKGDSLVMEITNKYKSLEWENGNKTYRNVIRPTQSGYTWVVVKDTNGCERKEIVQYTVNNCGSSSGCDVISAWPDAVLCGDNDSVLVEAKSGYSAYLWSDGNKGRIRTILKAGVYILQVKDATGKSCYDTLEVIAGSGPGVRIQSNPNPAVICRGDSIKLYVQGDYKGIKWSNGSDNWYVYVKPEKTTSFSVKVTGKNGCTSVEDIQVEVKECNSCEVIQWNEKRTLCDENDSIVLEAQSKWVSYNWSTGSTSHRIVVRKSGWYKVTAKDRDGKSCTDSVYIKKGGKKLELWYNPNPAVVCPDDVVLIKGNEGFVQYKWNVTTSTNRIIEHKAKETKEIVAYALDSAGCWSRATMKITVRDTCKNSCGELISLGQKKVLCTEKDSIVLEVPNGYQSYKWADGPEGRVRWVKKEGWYKVTVKDKDGKTCSDSVKILRGGKLRLAVEIDPAKYCVGDTITAIANKGFRSYAWNTGSKERSTQFVAQRRKVLVVEATDEAGCEYRLEKVVEADTCTSSIPSIRAEQLKIYPNPTTGGFFVSGKEAPLKISVYNVVGVEVARQSNCRNVQYMALKDAEKGVYLVKVDYGTFTVTRKLVLH